MTSTTQSPLLAAATTTFESLALLLPSPNVSAREAAGTTAIGVGVAFTGPLRGYLALRVTDDVARALAANMLGVDEPAPALVRDALGEVANVVCGNLLPSLAGQKAVFHLSAPAPLGAPNALEAPALAASLGIDGGRAEVTLHLDPSTPLPAAS